MRSASPREAYRRRYTLDEMLDVFSGLTRREGSGRDRDERLELRSELADWPLWRRARVPLDDLMAEALRPEKVLRYAARRRRGSRFPPVVAVPVAPDRGLEACARWGIPYARYDVVEGNHRVLAARAAGDATIDAFVPEAR